MKLNELKEEYLNLLYNIPASKRLDEIENLVGEDVYLEWMTEDEISRGLN